MLMPKRTKFRKVQRGRMTGAASRGNYVSYGDYGIQALEPGWITANQIEAARVAGLPSCMPTRSCSKSAVFPMMSPKRHSVSLSTSFRSAAGSSKPSGTPTKMVVKHDEGKRSS